MYLYLICRDVCITQQDGKTTRIICRDVRITQQDGKTTKFNNTRYVERMLHIHTDCLQKKIKSSIKK